MSKQPEADDFDIAVSFTDPTVDALDVTDAPVEIVPITSVDAAPKPSSLARLKANLPLVIAGLAVFASLIATIGLIVASRNMAEANQRIAALELAVKEAATARTIVAAAPAHDSAARAAASPTDIRAALDDFRRDIVRYQSMGGQAGWVDAMRDGQAELANRINNIGEKLDRIDRRLSNSRPISPVADRARPS